MTSWWTDFVQCIEGDSDEKKIENELSKVNVSETYDRNGNNLLHYVAITSHASIADKLINLGCGVNCKNNAGEPPLLNAIGQNRINMVRLFLKRGAIVRNSYYNNGKGPLHVAAASGHIELYRLLLEAGCDTFADDNGTTLLHHVAMCNSGSDRIDLAKTLLAEGSDVNAKCNDGSTPLHFVSAYGSRGHGSEAMIELLLSSGAEIEARVESGSTPLFWAVIHDQFDTVIQLLRAGAKFDQIDPNGKTCLHYAVQNLQPEVVRLLLDQGIEVDAPDADGISPLWQGLQSCCVTLLYSRENYDECDRFIEFTYSLNQINNQVECISLLLEYGADLDSVCKIKKLSLPISPIYASILLNHHKIVRLLLKNGAIFDYDHRFGQMALKRLGSQDSRSIHELIKHTALMELQNRKDGPMNFRPERMKKHLQAYYASCKDELILMRATFVYRKLTFFQILTGSNIESYLRNKDVIAVLDSTCARQLFPIYYELLCDRHKLELQRVELSEETLLRMGQLLEWPENQVYVVFGNVFRYLDKRDLRKLLRL